MRVSEVYGLTWDCVDFENKTLTINKNVIKRNQFGLPKRKCITNGHSVGTWYYGECKNPQSRRTIAIGDTLVNARKNQKHQYASTFQLTLVVICGIIFSVCNKQFFERMVT